MSADETAGTKQLIDFTQIRWLHNETDPQKGKQTVAGMIHGLSEISREARSSNRDKRQISACKQRHGIQKQPGKVTRKNRIDCIRSFPRTRLKKAGYRVKPANMNGLGAHQAQDSFLPPIHSMHL